jgi:hypothetical protein
MVAGVKAMAALEVDRRRRHGRQPRQATYHPAGMVSPGPQFGTAVLSAGGSAGVPVLLLKPEHESHSVLLVSG